MVDQYRKNFAYGWIFMSIIFAIIGAILRSVVWLFLSDERKKEIKARRAEKERKEKEKYGEFYLLYKSAKRLL